MKRLHLLVKNVFFQGAIVITLSNFAVGFINYLFHSLSAKALGPGTYSEVATLFSYITIFTLPLGITGNLIIQRLGYAGESRRVVAREFDIWLMNHFRKWKWALVLGVPIAFIIPHIANIALATAITLVILLVLTFFITFYNSVAQGLHLFVAFSYATIIIALIKFSGAILAYFHVYPLLSIYTTLVLGFTLQFLFILYFSRKEMKLSAAQKSNYLFTKRISAILRQRYVILSILSLLTFTLLSNADIIYVKRFYDAYDAGIYSSWSLFAKIITYICGPLQLLLFIFFSSEENKNKHAYMYRLLGFFSLAGISLYILYSIFGEMLVLLLFSRDYISIVSLLPKAAIFGYLYTVIGALNYYFIALKSKASLIVAVTIPMYLVGLWIFGRSIDMVININLAYSVGITIAYFLCLVQAKKTVLALK